jgi:hypothetical protein
MPGTPRQPKGPPLDSKLLKNKKSARTFLEKSRTEAEIESLVAAGELGLSLAEVFGYFYPYRKWVVGKKGALSQPSTTVPDDIIAFPSHRAELSYSEVLSSKVNPKSARLADGHKRLQELAPLAQLSAIGGEALHFLETYSSLRLHADRLRRALASDPMAMKRLATMRSPRQMFCACVLIQAKRMGISEPTSGELAALTLQLNHVEFIRDMVTGPDETLARLRAWDQQKRDVRSGLSPFLEKLLATPLDDPEDAS